LGESLRLLHASSRRSTRALPRDLRDSDDRALAAGNLDRPIAVERVQDWVSAAPSPCSASSVSGLAG
jgi:hypothetical protein